MKESGAVTGQFKADAAELITPAPKAVPTNLSQSTSALPRFQQIKSPIEQETILKGRSIIRRYSINQEFVNAPLRSGKLSPTTKEEVDLAVAFLESLDSYVGTVQRGVHFNDEMIQELRKLVGGCFCDPAFLSTTKKPLKDLGGFRDRNCHFIIESKKKGKSIVRFVSKHKMREDEVLFPPGTNFRLTSIQEFPDKKYGRYVIHMEEIVP